MNRERNQPGPGRDQGNPTNPSKPQQPGITEDEREVKEEEEEEESGNRREEDEENTQVGNQPGNPGQGSGH